jgi:1-acyl-sn-glycerol-3-phosphate acyltransferase
VKRSMGYTIFDTPVIRTLIRWACMLTLKFWGWKAEGKLPGDPKFVLIAVPHTSNWDFPIMMAIAFKLKAKIYWMGKNSLFRKPFGTLFRWLGGIPIDRSRSANTVDSMIAVFNASERLIVIIPPSGTRKRVSQWKSGFYHIANGAGIPVVMGYLDYPAKRGGIGPAILPTGDISRDMAAIRHFYADIEGKYPQQRIRPVPLKKGIPS